MRQRTLAIIILSSLVVAAVSVNHMASSHILLPYITRSGATDTPEPTRSPRHTPTVTPTPTVAVTGLVVIGHIHYDGTGRNEPDEYIRIDSFSAYPVNMTGWRIYAGDPGQDFYFPDGFILEQGASCRIRTNELHPDSCGLTWGSNEPIWNNNGDCGTLYDGSGVLKSTFCYP